MAALKITGRSAGQLDCHFYVAHPQRRRNAKKTANLELGDRACCRRMLRVRSEFPGGSHIAERLLAWLEPREVEMAALLAELVSVGTENPPGRNYEACSDLLERKLLDAGLTYERHEFPAPNATVDVSSEPATSLLASFGGGKRTLHFHGHYDVVPAQSPEQFQPVCKEHFLFGRGSCDMKGGIVSMLYAIRALRDCDVELNGKIALTLVPDEETGGARGSAWLAAQGLLGANGIGMLLAEPTSGVVWNANRGAISLRIRVLGKSAHVGLQHRGENAFEQMVRVVERLQGLKLEVERKQTEHAVAAEQNRNSILMLGGESGGGANFNIVPEQCWFTIDRRINPEEDFDAEKNRLIGVLEQCRSDGIRLEWDILQEGQAAACSPEEKLGRALAQSVKAITGEAPQFEMCPGLLEIRFYNAIEIPAYAYGPGLLSVAHGPNEYVDLRKVRWCAAIYALTAIEMFNA
jgi:acetylornithine deacetylase/succinyl-diaminopimelate desuccinylase family protein